MIPLLSSVLAGLWLIAVQPAVAQASNWSSQYRDQTNRNAVIDQPALPFSPAGSLPNKLIRPLTEGDMVITVESNLLGNWLVAHQLSNLQPLWRVSLGSDIPQQPTIHQGSVYFGISNRPAIVSVNLLSGYKRWTQTLVGETGGIRFAPIVIDRYLFVAGAKLHRLSIDGDYHWWQPYMAASPMATDGETLFARLHQMQIVAINPADGRLRWSYSTNTTTGTAPVVTADLVYLGTYQQIVALDKATGLKRWHYITPLSTPLIGDIAAAGNRIFVSTNAGDIMSFDAAGQLLWRNQFNTGSYNGNGWQAQFILAGDQILALADWWAHIVIDVYSGNTLFTGRLGEADGLIRAISDDRILLTSIDQTTILTAHHWSLGSLVEAPPTKQRDPLVIIPGIMGSWPVNGQWQLDPVLHTFEGLMAALGTAGYVDNLTLFTFPYDWHRPNQDTAQLLAARIAGIRQQTGAERVDIIAHSMGGLISRSYIQSVDYRNDVDQLIMLGSPHRGSVKSYLTWEAGETGTDVVDTLKEKFIAYEAVKAGYGSDIVGYVQTRIPTVGQLLPTFDYLETDLGLLNYRPCLLADYPCNEFLESLNGSLDRLVERVRPLSIRGQESVDYTLKQLKVADSPTNNLWTHGMPINYPAIDGMIYGSGDGTVLTSATQLAGVESLTLSADHTQLVTTAAPIIVQRLTGQIIPVDQLIPPKRYLFVRLFSPIDIILIDPLGRRIGTDPATNQLINEVPNSFYSGNQTDLEYTIIPDPIPGVYQLELIGTGAGSYQLTSTLIGETAVSESTESSTVTVGQEIRDRLELNGNDLTITQVAPLPCRNHPSPKKECKKNKVKK